MQSSIFQDLCPDLTKDVIESIAKESEFCKRVGKKITPIDYLLFMCEESIKGTVSYNDLAAKASCDHNIEASRQAYFYRTKDEAIEFFKGILQTIIRHKNNLALINKTSEYESTTIKRILIQDSTIIRLPNKLYEVFSGVKNATSITCNARIQGIYDLLSGQFITFSIDTYSENDLAVANNIDVREGDLVLRDRGYFVLSVIRDMKEQGADSIMRYKHKTVFYDPDSLEAIDLLATLKLKGSLDMMVLCGTNKNIKLRILACPVSEEVANLRRMKAKKDAKGRSYSNELSQLFGWTIFITTIMDTSFTIKNAMRLYALRWRIECIFKTWKSNLSFTKIHNVSELQLRVILHARFIMITLYSSCLYTPLEYIVGIKYGKKLSLLKFMRYISRNAINFIEQFKDGNRRDVAIDKIARYCTYEKRKRCNFLDSFEAALL